MDRTNGQDHPYLTHLAPVADSADGPRDGLHDAPEVPGGAQRAPPPPAAAPPVRSASLWRGTRERLELILWSGGLSPDDVVRLLRAQILTPPAPPAAGDGADDVRPCCAPAAAGASRRPPVQLPPVRLVRQAQDPDPLAPSPVARTALRCPLEERAERGDPTVPCYKARALHQRGIGVARLKARTRSLREHIQRQSLAAVQQAHLTPCTVLHEVLCHSAHKDELLQIGKQPDQTPLERAALLVLIDSGRLTQQDLAALVERSLLVTASDWLPCKDDRGRVLWPPSAQDLAHDQRLREALEHVPPVRLRCPLQVRALLGDRTVPCAEAQRMAPDPVAIARVTASTGAAPYPGGPAADLSDDPVHTHELRPCHLLGRVLAKGLFRHLQDLAGDPLAAADHEDKPPEDLPRKQRPAKKPPKPSLH